MLHRLRAHAASNAVAYVALFVALGGTSYAAIKLPSNSVGNKQLRSGAVTSAKVRDGSLSPKDFAAAAVGTRGPRGPQGPPGPSSAASGGGGGNLASGQTVRGRFEAGGLNQDAGAGDVAADSISFGVRLPAPPARTVVFTPGANAAECPGSVAEPEAPPGRLCIYVGDRANVSAVDTITESGNGTTSRHGAGIYSVNSSAAAPGGFGARGSWAVTAP